MNLKEQVDVDAMLERPKYMCRCTLAGTVEGHPIVHPSQCNCEGWCECHNKLIKEAEAKGRAECDKSHCACGAEAYCEGCK